MTHGCRAIDRIRYLREALEYVLGHGGVWPATGAEILDACKEQA